MCKNEADIPKASAEANIPSAYADGDIPKAHAVADIHRAIANGNLSIAYADLDDAFSDEEITRRLALELTVLDESYFVPKPNLFQLEAILTEHKRKLSRKLRRELMLFLLAAVLILSLFAALLVRLPVLFMVIQATFVLFPLIFLFLPQRTHGDRRWGP